MLLLCCVTYILYVNERERERDIVEALRFLQISSQTRIWYLFSISPLPVRYISRMGVLLSVVAHLKFLTKISNFAAAFLPLHLPPHRPCLLVYNKILCFIYKIIIDSVSVYLSVCLSLFLFLKRNWSSQFIIICALPKQTVLPHNNKYSDNAINNLVHCPHLLLALLCLYKLILNTMIANCLDFSKFRYQSFRSLLQQ